MKLRLKKVILAHPDFWHYPPESLCWILTHQIWQIDYYTGSLDVLTGAGETEPQKIKCRHKIKYTR